MKRIKFRFWSHKDNVMLDWLCLSQTAFNTLSVSSQKNATHYFSPLIYRVLFPWEMDGELMLCTGIEDVNGRDIYEGDILEGKHGGKKHLLEVRWDERTAGFFLYNDRKGLQWHLSGSGDEDVFRIVGNKYQHPTLYRTTNQEDEE